MRQVLSVCQRTMTLARGRQERKGENASECLFSSRPPFASSNEIAQRHAANSLQAVKIVWPGRFTFGYNTAGRLIWTSKTSSTKACVRAGPLSARPASVRLGRTALSIRLKSREDLMRAWLTALCVAFALPIAIAASAQTTVDVQNSHVESLCPTQALT
jgi:hypothetical protein